MKRRAFLARSGGAIGGSWVAMSLPTIVATASVACKAREEGSAFRVLTPSEAVELEAMAAQIIPSGDSPGAREAGVIYFMDAALADARADALEPMREGLAELRADVRETYDAESFAGLDHDQQLTALHAIEDTDFFGSVRFLTLAGMFSHPSYGGNRDETGWKLIGFDGQRPTRPPFGYYDADYAEKGE
ncbi:MAG: gluconate 2-dehydrogenase subunit 3 family protein [Gemmatimonadota bacterium]